jgi:REP-associated tyrosine transposase
VDYPGATHHVFNRGVARSVVAVDGIDYSHALNLLEQMIARFELRCHAWCYLPNHFHLLLTSQLGNLSDAMHWLGTCTAAAFNLRHERSGWPTDPQCRSCGRTARTATARRPSRGTWV